MTDLIIGCYTDYNWDKIKFWVNSIEKSGFTGDKAMVVFNSDFATVQQLLNRGFNIFAFNRNDEQQRFFYPGNFSVVVQRFYHMWQFLNQLPEGKNYDNVIATDVKDVVFQTNPSEWLTKNMGNKKLLVSSESLKYANEPWGNENMARSFPMMHSAMMDKTIWNCGVLAGKADVIKDLFLNIYLSCLGAPQHVPGGGGPDQAALNILLNLEPYKKITKYVESEAGWACQAGTTVDPSKIENYRPYLLEPSPKWDGEFATTHTGKRYAVLHQWDRIPDWKHTVEERYG